MFFYAMDDQNYIDIQFGGRYWENPELLERQNPIRFVSSWQTPMLAFHGTKDFRVPYLQSVAAFSALRRMDVPARLVIYRNEGHAILTPTNTLNWMEESLNWMHYWTSTEGPKN